MLPELQAASDTAAVPPFGKIDINVCYLSYNQETEDDEEPPFGKIDINVCYIGSREIAVYAELPPFGKIDINVCYGKLR